MKRMLIFWLLATVAQFSAAQNLVESPRGSYTFVYRLSEADARQAYQQNLDSIYLSYFSIKVDSFGMGRPAPRLTQAGTYLYLQASNNQLEAELDELSTFTIELFNHPDKLAITVYDSLGNRRTDARVAVDSKPAKYHAASGTYRRNYRAKYKLVEVRLNGHTSFFPLEPRPEGGFFLAKVYRRIIYFKSVYYIWKPFQDIVQSIKYGELQGWLKIFEPNSQPYTGYLITQKPVYRPGDTVYYKAAVLKHGKLIDRNFNLELYGRFKNSTDSYARYQSLELRKNLEAYRKGLYTGSFVLSDTLPLVLDRPFDLRLVSGYRSLSTQLYYEDYELKGDQFTLSVSEEKHTLAAPPTILLNASDANNLPLQGAQVSLYLQPEQVYIAAGTSIRQVPDTLWQTTVSLNTAGSYEISLPDSLFGEELMDYRLIARLKTAENKFYTEEQPLSYLGKEKLKLYETNGILRAELVSGDSSLSRMAEIIYRQAQLTVTDSVKLPFETPLNPNWQAVTVLLNRPNNYKTLNMGDIESGVQISTKRTEDSVWVYLANPRQLPVSFQVYEGKGRNKKLVTDAYTEDSLLTITHRAKAKQIFFSSANFVWAGQTQWLNDEIPLLKNWVTLEMLGPKVLKPGQQASYTVQAKDYQGRPVPKLDVSTFAYNAKLPQRYTQQLDYLGKEKWYPNRLYARRKLSQPLEVNRQLNYPWFKQKLGLDSLEFYHFLYPGSSVYTAEVESPDSTTQFSPYIVINGAAVPVIAIYLNNLPIYFTESATVFPYAFPVVSDTILDVRLRTAGKEYRLQHRFRPGHKTILSFTDKAQTVQVTKVPLFLTDEELAYLNRFLIKIETSNKDRYTFLQQGKRVQLLLDVSYPYHSNSTKLAGPFYPGYTIAKVFADSTQQPIEWPLEGGYQYSVKPGLVLGKPFSLYNYRRLGSAPPYSFGEFALQPDSIRAQYYHELELSRQQNVNTDYPRSTSATEGKIEVGYETDSEPRSETAFLQQIMVVSLADSGFTQLYPGRILLEHTNRTLHGIPPGSYKLIGFLGADSVVVVPEVPVGASATTYINLAKAQKLPANTNLMNLRAIIQQRLSYGKKVLDLKEATSQYLDKVVRFDTPIAGRGNQTVSGVVTSQLDGSALPGVAVQIKGISQGVTTNIDGEFSLKCYSTDKLVFSFIGYLEEEVQVGGRSFIKVELQESLEALEEVVVTAYGVSNARQEVGYASVTVDEDMIGALSGVAVGIPITQDYRMVGASANQILLRGQSSISGEDKPLVVVNGVPISGELAIDQANIASMSVLKGAEATALYGARAAGGVIIITTKTSVALPNTLTETLAAQGISRGGGLRTNFRDWAIWQPTLLTNEQGQASFTLTFPDNITAWETHTLAIGNRRLSGQRLDKIQAVSTLWTSLSTPRYLLAGDSTYVMGSVSNLSGDTLAVISEFSADTASVSRRRVHLSNSLKDSVLISPADTTNILLTYKVVEESSGELLDGEQRKLEVYPLGSEEARGHSQFLPVGASANWELDSAGWAFSAYSFGNFPIREDLRYLIEYPFNCNEQLASKLIGLIMLKKAYPDETLLFTAARVKSVINRLEKNQNHEGLWSWWGSASSELWVSRHVLEALALAEEAGFTNSVDRRRAIDGLRWKWQATDELTDKLTALAALLNVDTLSSLYTPAVDSLTRNVDRQTSEIKLQALQLRNQAGLPWQLDSLLALKKETALGGYYWGAAPAYLPQHDALAYTAGAYQLLRAKNDSLSVAKTEQYFWESRNGRCWLNTYASAQVVRQLANHISTPKTKNYQPALSYQTANQSGSLSSFEPGAKPLVITSGQLSVRNTGNVPLFVNAHTTFWNANPQAVQDNFQLTTTYQGATGSIKQGEPLTLNVTVKVARAAEYVMLEIPIPAGCTYEAKDQAYGEVYREYYRDRVAIFVRSLPEGEYTYALRLMPSFSGNYQVNPAKASLMYFPEKFGRTAVERVEIK